MENEENKENGSLLSGQEPHQREELDQATGASAGSFTLEPQKGITPEPDEYNKGGEQGNIKQLDDRETDMGSSAALDSVSEIDLDADETTVTAEDLRALDGIDDDESTL